MKSRTTKALFLMTILAYLVGLCNASAFYDSGAQRWLNRDPIQEKGGYDLYSFASDDAINTIDANGLDPNNGNNIPVNPPQIPITIPPSTIYSSPSGCGPGNGLCSNPIFPSQCIPGTYSPITTYTKPCPNGGTITCWKWRRCKGETFPTYPKGHGVTVGIWEDQERCDPCPSPKCP